MPKGLKNIMNNIAVQNLLDIINNRPVVIWGARMTGIGFHHFAKRYNLNAVGFVDSDPSLTGGKIYDLKVDLPSQLSFLKSQYRNLLVIIAVSTKEDEINNLLNKNGFSSKDYINYKDYCEGFFTIDISGICNLKCPSCANSLLPAECHKGFMSLEDFKNITRKILDEVGLISHFCLYNWGEPLLHPQIDLFIDYAHQMGIAVAVSTNFSVDSTEQLHKLVKSSPDIFKISVSGYYPDVYEVTHTGGNIDLVKSNMYRLKYYRERYHSSFPVEVNYHLYNNNIGIDLTKMKELCKELDFLFSTCYANVAPIERIIKYCQGNIDEKTKELSKLLLVDIKNGLEVTKPFHHLPCRFLDNQININWDRSVSLCCASYDSADVIISVDFLKTSLKEIKMLKRNRSLCKICMAYGIPQYILGVNRPAWDKVANQKNK